MKKFQVKKFLAENSIPGEISGKGSDWEVELPNEEAYEKWAACASFPYGGYRCGYGGWVVSPDYECKGDFNDPSSRWHY